jgi:hypothetical protein
VEYPKPVSNFKILRKGDSVFVEREVLKADSPFPVTSKNWRFNWYIAWNNSKISHKTNSNTEKDIVNLDLGEIPNCFHARKYKKLFKNKVRSLLNSLNGNTLLLDNISPSICRKPSHVARAADEFGLHWDLGDLIDLWF